MAGRPYDVGAGDGAAASTSSTSSGKPNMMPAVGYYNGGNAMAASLLAQSKLSSRPYLHRRAF